MAQKYIFKKQSLSDHKNQIYCKISRWVKKPKKVIVIYTKKKKNLYTFPQIHLTQNFNNFQIILQL